MDEFVLFEDAPQVPVSWAVGRDIYRWFERAREIAYAGDAAAMEALSDRINRKILSLAETKLAWDTAEHGMEIPHTAAWSVLWYIVDDAVIGRPVNWARRWAELCFQVPEVGRQKWLAAGADGREAAGVLSSLEIMSIREGGELQ